MSVTTMRARLAAHYRAISGITTAFEKMPTAIQHQELPAVVIRVSPAQYSRITNDGFQVGEAYYIERRLYRAQLFVKEISEGAEGAAEDALLPFLDSVSLYFWERPALLFASDNNIPAVYSHFLQSDTGAITTAQYPRETGKTYGAIEFVHQIETLNHIDFKD